jgi:transcriptional antiterminator RfaH
MWDESLCESPRWYLIHTQPKQESRAQYNLEAWKVETLAPKLKERRFNPYTGAPFYIIKPLFPSYIFARFKPELLGKVHYTRGVRRVVSFGDVPVTVEDQVIEAIRARTLEDGFVRIGEELKPGDRVLIKSGPLKNLSGVFERELKASERVTILLTSVTYQSRMTVERNIVQKEI